MTDLEMLKHLLKVSGRIYDEAVDSRSENITIQIHFNDTRWEWNFDSNGKLIEDWENPHESQWISEQWRYD
jgi:hypothetical protein